MAKRHSASGRMANRHQRSRRLTTAHLDVCRALFSAGSRKSSESDAPHRGCFGPLWGRGIVEGPKSRASRARGAFASRTAKLADEDAPHAWL
jgi:hypothetical protein